jgi:hypothetical protein
MERLIVIEDITPEELAMEFLCMDGENRPRFLTHSRQEPTSGPVPVGASNVALYRNTLIKAGSRQ